MHKNNVLERIRIGRPPFGGSVKHECDIWNMPSQTDWGKLPEDAFKKRMPAADVPLQNNKVVSTSLPNTPESTQSLPPTPSIQLRTPIPNAQALQSNATSVHAADTGLSPFLGSLSTQVPNDRSPEFRKELQEYIAEQETHDAYQEDANEKPLDKYWESIRYNWKNYAKIKKFAKFVK